MKTIFTALSPNVEPDDVRLALSLIFQPGKWKNGGAKKQLEEKFQEFLPIKHAIAFASGRSALHVILKSLNLAEHDEVLLQAYTCVAVPEPILWNKLTPIYVDIDTATYTMSPDDLRKKITPRSRVLIVQHTFGLPAHLTELLAIAREHNLFVIEDCAHALGARYQNRNVGTFGDASFFSFGRDKVISSVFGGMAVTNDDAIGKKIAALQSPTAEAPSSWIFQQLIHPPIMTLVKKTYDWMSVGKIILKICQRMDVVSKAVYPIERSGGKPEFAEWTLPNALALLALNQFAKLEMFNLHRKKITDVYRSLLGQYESPFSSSAKLEEVEPVYLRYTISHAAPETLIAKAKKQGLILGDWYMNAIAPYDVNYQAVQYDPQACPQAEVAARKTINLPTSITITEIGARRIANFITTYEH